VTGRERVEGEGRRDWAAWAERESGPRVNKERKGERERWAAGEKLGQAGPRERGGRQEEGLILFYFSFFLFKSFSTSFQTFLKSNLLHFYNLFFINYFKDF
jgi:hypothetical protein